MPKYPTFNPKYYVHPVLFDIRQEAVRQKLSIQTLADKSGYGTTTIKDMFRHSNPKLQTLEALANVVGLTLDVAKRKVK